MRQLKLPKILQRALVVVISKPNKPTADPKNYRPISLLCIPHKILDRLIYACVEPIIDPSLLRGQAGFRRGKSTVDQVTLLTQEIEDIFSAEMKAVLCLSISQQPIIALQPHLQVSAGHAPDLNDHEACPQPQFHPHHRC